MLGLTSHLAYKKYHSMRDQNELVQKFESLGLDDGVFAMAVLLFLAFRFYFRSMSYFAALERDTRNMEFVKQVAETGQKVIQNLEIFAVMTGPLTRNRTANICSKC